MKSFKKIACGCLSAALIATTVTLTSAPMISQAASPKLNKTSATLTVGKKLTLKVQNAKKGATIKWSSSDKTVATVSAKGVVKAKAAGKTTIKAVVSKKTLQCKVTVKEQAGSNTSTNTDPNTNADPGTNTDPITEPENNTNAKTKDITSLLAGKSYKGTATTAMGEIKALELTFGTDGTVKGEKMNETTLVLDSFTGTYKAELTDKKVTITVEADGKTFSEELTVENDDFSKLTATKNIMGMDIVINVEEVSAS